MNELTEASFRNRVLCSIAAKQTISDPIIGISFFEPSNGLISVAEIKDSEQLSELESLLIRNKPSNIVYSTNKNKFGFKRLNDISSGSSIIEELEYPKISNIEDIDDLISPLLRKQCNNYNKELESELIRISLYNLIRHFQLIQSKENNSQCELKFLLTDTFMRMDSACIHSLRIFPEKGESARSPTNLLGLLNKTRTKIGARRLELWLRQPLISEKQIHMRHDVVEFFYKNDALRQKIYGTHLRKVCDLEQITIKFKSFASYFKIQGSKLGESKCNLEDMVKLYDSVIQSNHIFLDIKTTLDEIENSDSCENISKSVYDLILIPLEAVLTKFKDYIRLVERTIDLEEAEHGNYLIIPHFTPELERLSNEKVRISKRIESHRKELDSYLCNERGYNEGSREAVRVIRGEGTDTSLCFRVTRKDIEYFQDKKRYQQVRINKNDYLFRTNEIRELSDQEERILKEYDREQSQVLIKTISVASTYWPLVSRLSLILGSIDVLLSFALTSLCAPIPFVRPRVLSGECILDEDIVNQDNIICNCRFYCRQLRHPLIEAQGITSTANQFIPNDVDIHRHGSLLNIITGPNMGGKSTYIRQIAICCLLSQIGCFVPAQEASIPIMDQLMCRIGASDAQILGISTFLAEMIEASAILRSATRHTLVIVDELGRGTSTYDGFGLAWSIANFLVNHKQCYTLFATHFHELSSLASSSKNVANLRVTATTSKTRDSVFELNSAPKGILKFFYKVEKGFADKSLGVDVAELSGLPKETIKRSREKAEDLTQIEQIYISPYYSQNKKRNQLNTISSIVKSNLTKILNLVDSTDNYVDFKQKASESIQNLKKTLGFPVVSN